MAVTGGWVPDSGLVVPLPLGLSVFGVKKGNQMMYPAPPGVPLTCIAVIVGVHPV